MAAAAADAQDDGNDNGPAAIEAQRGPRIVKVKQAATQDGGASVGETRMKSATADLQLKKNELESDDIAVTETRAPSGASEVVVGRGGNKESAPWPGDSTQNNTSSANTDHPVIIDLASDEEGHQARRASGSAAASTLQPGRPFTCDGGYLGQGFARLPALLADDVGESVSARVKRLGVQHALIARRLRDAGCLVLSGVELGPRVFLVRLPSTKVVDNFPTQVGVEDFV